MSTKINVRSPFYLNLTEPSAPEPLFNCDVAGIQNLSIDQQGQISQAITSLGTILSVTSTDAGFSNDKFATVSTATDRNLTIRIAIPAGYSNTTDGYIDCDRIVTQPAYVANTSCSGGPTASGSISAITIDVGGDTDTVDLSNYFTAGSDPIAGYNVYVGNQQLLNASVSGNTLTVYSNAIGGSTNVNVSAYDNGSNTCTASQSVAVTVSAPNTAFSCSDAAFSGGSIANDGTIVKPNSVAAVGTIKSTSGGSAITSYSANNTGSDRTVTLYFDLTAPAGYSNAGSTVECSRDFVQPASTPEFTCTTANISGGKISRGGIVDYGTAALGEITGHTSTASDFSNGKFAEVTSDTVRSVTFTVSVPSGYSNSGTIDCTVSLTQPGQISPCGSNTFYLATAMTTLDGYCNGSWQVSRSISTPATSISNALGKQVCKDNAPYLGGNFYYAVSAKKTTVGDGTGTFYMWKIDDEGIVRDVATWDCPTDGVDYGSGAGKGKGGSL